RLAGHDDCGVDYCLGQHAHRAAGAVEQFNGVAHQVLQANTINGVGVGTAYLHDLWCALVMLFELLRLLMDRMDKGVDMGGIAQRGLPVHGAAPDSVCDCSSSASNCRVRRAAASSS